MKKFFYFIGILVLILFIVGNIFTFLKKNEDVKHKDLIVLVSKICKHCPISIADGMGRISSIQVDSTNDKEAKHYVTYFLDLDYPTESLKNYIKKHKLQSIKAMLYLWICSGQGSTITHELIKQKVDIKIIINPQTENKFTTTLTTEELQSFLKDDYLKSSPILLDGLNLLLNIEKSNFPIIVDEGLIMKSMQLKGHNIICNLVCDESIYNIKTLNDSANSIVNRFMQTAKIDPDVAALLTICKETHTNLIYQYTGEITGKKATLVFNHDLIKTFHRGSRLELH